MEEELQGWKTQNYSGRETKKVKLTKKKNIWASFLLFNRIMKNENHWRIGGNLAEKRGKQRKTVVFFRTSLPGFFSMSETDAAEAFMRGLSPRKMDPRKLWKRAIVKGLKRNLHRHSIYRHKKLIVAGL